MRGIDPDSPLPENTDFFSQIIHIQKRHPEEGTHCGADCFGVKNIDCSAAHDHRGNTGCLRRAEDGSKISRILYVLRKKIERDIEIKDLLFRIRRLRHDCKNALRRLCVRDSFRDFIRNNEGFLLPLSDPVSKLIVVRCLAGNLRKKLLRNIELLQKFIRRILTKTLAFDKENTLFTALSGLLPEGAEAFDS